MKIRCLFIFIVITCYSCNKNDSSTNNPQPNTTNNLLVKWKYDHWEKNGVLQNLSSCDKNGYVQFNSNGTFERKDYWLMSNTCVIEGEENGTYTFNSTTKKITLVFNDISQGPQTEIWNNVELTDKALKFSWDENKDGNDEHLIGYIKY